jgi:DNA repair exonuclease SbcCD ATPase subunit
MIVKRIGVTNWRGFLDPMEMGPFSERLNVIHAPNGTGKSSLFEAMRRALFDVHHVGGAEIEEIRPWGRKLSPSVFVEFSEGGNTYRVEKTFMDGASAKLFQEEEGRFQPIADGRNADTRLREILSADPPGRGLCRQEHWGLGQILWAPQGELALKQISGGVGESLRSALGMEVSGASGSRLEELVEARFLEFFTRGGAPKKGKNAAPVVAWQQKQETLEQELVDLREEHRRYEEASRQVDDARNRREQARREADALRESVAGLRKAAEEYVRLKNEQVRKKEIAEIARERFESIGRTLEEIKATRETIEGLEKSVATLSGENEQAKADVAAAKALLEKTRTAREVARRRRDLITEKQKTIDAARDYHACRDELTKLEQRLERLEEHETELGRVKKERAEMISPDPAKIRELRRRLGERAAARAALAASQVHLTLTPRKDCEIENLTDAGKHTIKGGSPTVFSGDEVVEVLIREFGSVRASGPEGGADAHRAHLEAAETRIKALSQPFGSDDPDYLQKRREEADALDQRIAALRKQIEMVLDGEERDSMVGRRNELNAMIDDFEGQHPNWRSAPPVVGLLQTEFETFSRDVNESVASAEDAFERSQSDHAAAEKRQVELNGMLKAGQGNLETAGKRLKVLVDDGLSDNDRDKKRSEALMAWQAAKAGVEAAESELNSIPGDPARELEKLEKQRQVMEEEVAHSRDQEKSAEGRLQALAARGTYSRLAACEESLAEVADRIRRESLRMDAIRLLYETVRDAKGALLARVTAPVEESASRMLARVAGPRLGRPIFTQDFVPDAINPEISAGPVNLQNLSGGEQEQLHLIARLALADLLAKDQRQLVVLDDVLNATDSGRLRRVLSLLEEISERLQIIILTCHPERYRALEGAEFFALTR